MMYWWTDKITEAALRQRGGGMETLRMDKNDTMWLRSNPWHELWNRNDFRHIESWRCKICIWDTTAYVRSQETFDFLREANKSVARPQGEAIFIVMDSGYIQLEKVLNQRSCDLLHCGQGGEGPSTCCFSSVSLSKHLYHLFYHTS